MKKFTMFPLLALLCLPTFPAMAEETGTGVLDTLPPEILAGNYQSDMSDEPFLMADQVRLLAVVKIGKMDTYKIPIQDCGKSLGSVKLQVSEAGIYVDKFGIRFTDNATKDYNVNMNFAVNYDSPWVKLDKYRAMDSRCLAEVYFTARSEGTQSTLKVLVQLK
ncbi:MAG TPA: hypothetical protein VIH99_05070 [Bdellovibrionota bacterium]|jgi:hypothetical protein